MSTPPRHIVAIAGGGIGGFTTALALAKRRIASCVYEQRPIFEAVGAGIQLGPNGTRILGDLGVSEKLKPNVDVPNAIKVHNAENGKLLAELPLGSWINERHGSPYWVAHRADLHAALRARIREEELITCVLGTAVEDAQTSNDGVKLVFNDGKTAQADAFIAADGVWSTARKKISGSDLASPNHIGKSAARTVIPISELPTDISKTDVTIWLSPTAHVVHYPVGAGKELAMVLVLDDAHEQKEWNAGADPAWIDDGTKHFPASLRALISQAKDWRKWSLFDLDLGASWTSGRTALLGDAAHPVLPFLAQGAVLAMEDAVTLASCLAEKFPNNIGEALSNYESRRRPRAKKVQQASRQNGEIYHASAVLAGARDLTLRGVPADRLMARYDWLYGWTL